MQLVRDVIGLQTRLFYLYISWALYYSYNECLFLVTALLNEFRAPQLQPRLQTFWLKVYKCIRYLCYYKFRFNMNSSVFNYVAFIVWIALEKLRVSTSTPETIWIQTMLFLLPCNLKRQIPLTHIMVDGGRFFCQEQRWFPWWHNLNFHKFFTTMFPLAWERKENNDWNLNTSAWKNLKLPGCVRKLSPKQC